MGSRPQKGPADRFVLGEWNAQCDQCDGKRKASELHKNWKGQMVCERCWEPRHPQDFVRTVPREEPPPWVRPQGEAPVVVTCSLQSSLAIPDLAIPGCMLPGRSTPFTPGEWDFCTVFGSICKAGLMEAGCVVVGRTSWPA